MNRAVDIFILSGFLGSGKSTLLKELIRIEKENGRRIGVLMNELGDTNIDSFVLPNDTPMREMLNGCICCSIQGELTIQIKQLMEEYELDVIYIEATGAAHPLEVLDACTHPTIANQVIIKGVLTVVNAKQWSEGKLSNKLKKLLRAQVAFADVVLVNKIDQVNEDAVQFIIDGIREVNEQAVVSPVLYSKLEPSILYSSVHTPFENKPENCDHLAHLHVHEHLHLRTVTFPVDFPVDRISFLHWLSSIEGQLHRVKGFIHLKETAGLFLFNYAYGDPIFERHRSTNNSKSVLVFIGENLDKNGIGKGLQQLK